MLGQVKNVATVTLGKMLQSSGRGDDVKAPYLRAANVQPDGVLAADDLNLNEMWFSQSEFHELDVRAGDVVVVEGGQGGYGRAAYVPRDLVGVGFQNSINRLRPTPLCDGRYLTYCLLSLRASGYIAAYSNVVSMPHLTAEKLAALPVPIPPASVQQAIADFLDRETAQIDTLIEEQQRLIQLLSERRGAVVSSVFADVAHNSRVKHACLDVVDCPHTTPDVTDEGRYEAVRTASVRGGKYQPGHGLRVNESTWRERNAGGFPQLGDILFTREAPAGEACMVPSADVCLGQRMVLLRVDQEVCVGEFLLWQLYADRIQDKFRLSASGSTVGNVRLPVLRATSIWLPSLSVQREILTYLDEQTAEIDTLISEAERFIELARERRAALITAAVTGQLDVQAV
jgi:type I restriction enzyme S subunit